MTTPIVIEKTFLVQEQPTNVVVNNAITTVVPSINEVNVVALNTTSTTVINNDDSTIVTIPTFVNVVSKGESIGPRIYFSPTPPFGADINDIWVRTI
jgi:hypothetical protein